MNSSEYNLRKEQIEIQKVEKLFCKLAEFREKLKSHKKEQGADWYDKVSNWAIRIIVYSFAPILGCSIAVSVAGLLIPGNGISIPLWIVLLVVFSAFFVFIGMLLFLISLIIFSYKNYSRSEEKKAQETFFDIQPYLIYSAELSREFNSSTLEKAQLSINQENTEFSRRGNFITSFLKNLPSALWWTAVFIFFSIFMNSGKLYEVISNQNINSYNKLLESLSNFIFSSVIYHLSPYTILNIVMYALIITLMAKTHPIIFTPMESRRSKRYHDYLRLIELAKDARKNVESTKTSKFRDRLI